MSNEWQPYDTAPFGRPIEARMPMAGLYAEHERDWVATIVRYHDEGHWTDGVSILHYNSATLQPGFRGTFTHWRELPTRFQKEQAS